MYVTNFTTIPIEKQQRPHALEKYFRAFGWRRRKPKEYYDHMPAPETYTVAQNEVAIAYSATELKTNSLYACSALIVVDGRRRLLTHVGSAAGADDLAHVVNRVFDIFAEATYFCVVPGELFLKPYHSNDSTDESQRVISMALNRLGVGQKLETFPLDLSSADDLVLEKSGNLVVRKCTDRNIIDAHNRFKQGDRGRLHHRY